MYIYIVCMYMYVGVLYVYILCVCICTIVGYHLAAFDGTHGTHTSELQVSFRKKAINCRALLQKVTYKQRASYALCVFATL